jgi:hypothetical protein
MIKVIEEGKKKAGFYTIKWVGRMKKENLFPQESTSID